MNGIKSLDIMEVYTTNDFAYDGNIYQPELDLEQPKGCLSYTSNHVKNSRKINNRSYDINASNYKKLTTNKDAKVIELYDDLEDYVLKKDRKIIRNYLVKGISFKYRCRILEVTLNEQEMILCFLKDVKIFDKENRLSIRKGYEKCSLKYKMRVGDENSLNYAKYLIDKEYEQITKLFMINHLNNLTKILTDNVKAIDKLYSNCKAITEANNFIRADYSDISYDGLEDAHKLPIWPIRVIVEQPSKDEQVDTGADRTHDSERKGDMGGTCKLCQ